MVSPYMDGTLPFAQRQSIEDYQVAVEPGLAAFAEALEAAGVGPWERFADPSEISPCGYPEDGYQVWSVTAFGKPFDPAVARRVAEQYLPALGFDRVYDEVDDYAITLKWFNTQHGGYVGLTIIPHSHAGFRYVSGCRPSAGYAPPERIITLWEQNLPLADPGECSRLT